MSAADVAPYPVEECHNPSPSPVLLFCSSPSFAEDRTEELFSRSAPLPCFAFVLATSRLPLLPCSGPTGTQAFQAEGPRVANKQARRRPLATRQSTKAGQLYCESLIIAALLPIRLKRNARHSKPVVATQQRILRIALTRERNVDDVIGFGFKWFALVCSAVVFVC